MVRTAVRFCSKDKRGVAISQRRSTFRTSTLYLAQIDKGKEGDATMRCTGSLLGISLACRCCLGDFWRLLLGIFVAARSGFCA